MSYSIRIRFKISTNRPLEIKENIIEIPHQGADKLYLHSVNIVESILISKELVLEGEGYETEEIARSTGEKYLYALSLAFAQLKLSADFEDKSSGKVIISDFWLKEIAQETGLMAHHDILGLNVIPSGSSLKIFMPIPTTSTSTNKEQFLKAICKSINLDPKIDSNKRVAFELFSASITSNYIDSRFLLLMMAIETLIVHNPRSEEARHHISTLITLTKVSNILTKTEKNSINSSLNWLYDDSISRSGRNLAKTLTGRLYCGMKPSNFFNYCYELR